MWQWRMALLALTVPALAAAQTVTRDTSPGLPLPSIGLPLPTIGLPHPATGLPPLESSPPRRDQAPQADGQGRHRRDTRALPSALVVSPLWFAFPMVVPAAPAPVVTPAPTVPPADGRVVIEAQPDAAQIYVDGYYVGMAADYPDGLPLAAGPHALDVRAVGFDSQSTSIQIPAGRSITYRAVLTRRATAASSALPPTPDAPAAAAGPPSSATFYLIRGCYLGNVVPSEAILPAGCDPAKAVTVRP